MTNGGTQGTGDRETVHQPVMLAEVLEHLALKPEGLYVDATVGGAGHSQALLSGLGAGGRLIGIDRDQEALEAAQLRLHDVRCTFVRGRFSALEELLAPEVKGRVDGVLMDFGISMMQMKGTGRGMSFLSQEPLDMRMDLTSALTAAEIVNEWPEVELARIIFEYGEERASRRIARGIVYKRKIARIETCFELAETVTRSLGGRKGSRVHPATRTFQALRMAVNDEIEEVKRGLVAASHVMAPGGRLVTIAYHSLEDREVKLYFRGAAKEGRMEIITKKPLRPTLAEVRANPSSRSACLRCVEV